MILGVAGSSAEQQNVDRPIFSLTGPIMYFVYILVCLQTRRAYVGQTDHLIRRYHAHLGGSTRTTREKLPHPVLVHWEICASRSDAMRREQAFKAGAGHRRKQEIIARAHSERFARHYFVLRRHFCKNRLA